MWKYIIFNAVWFGVLVSAPFFSARYWRLAVSGVLVVSAFIYAAQRSVDPFVWTYYLLFSILVFWSGLQFKRWALYKRAVLEEEISIVSQRLNASSRILQQKNKETEVINQKANDIYYTYDKIKEMTQCLDPFETLLVFGEALSGQLRFETITFALFDEENSQIKTPQEVYRLARSDYDEVFDKYYFLKNRKKYEIKATPALLKIFETIFRSHSPVNVMDASNEPLESGNGLPASNVPVIAYPIFMEKKIFGILVLSGVGTEQFPMLSILTERFIAEVERVKLYEKVETLAITDGLTGVCVRRHLLERLAGEIARSRKFGFDLSFLMIDVDYFKRFNDLYGHLVGDEVLRQAAETIRKNIRELDLVGRFGGEEFGVILVETDKTGAAFVAERIRSAIAEKEFTAYSENLKATVSIGCATFSGAESEISIVLETADRALYEAKHQGRNRVYISS